MRLREPEWLFPFDGMNLGDSFFIPTLKFADMTYAITSGAKRAKIGIRTAYAVKDNMIGIRAWRVY